MSNKITAPRGNLHVNLTNGTLYEYLTRVEHSKMDIIIIVLHEKSSDDDDLLIDRHCLHAILSKIVSKLIILDVRRRFSKMVGRNCIRCTAGDTTYERYPSCKLKKRI